MPLEVSRSPQHRCTGTFPKADTMVRKPGLAESLNSDLKLYGISVHCYFPGTILSPGYEEENKGKPAVTAKVEGDGETKLTPEQCADALIKSMSWIYYVVGPDHRYTAADVMCVALYSDLERGNFFITTDFVGHIARTAGAGAAPLNNVFIDNIYRLIGIVGQLQSYAILIGS